MYNLKQPLGINHTLRQTITILKTTSSGITIRLTDKPRPLVQCYHHQATRETKTLPNRTIANQKDGLPTRLYQGVCR